MSKRSIRALVCLASSSLLAAGLAAGARAQESPTFTPGNLVVSVEGCGVYGGTCTGVPNGSGNGVGNSSVSGYGDNQAAPLTLFQFQPSGTASATFINSLVFPQTGSGANLPVSGEYGSSSEAGIQLSGAGQYLTIVGYGINANTFNANPNAYSATPTAALAQSGSLTGQSYTPIPRVVTLVDPYGNVNTSTALFNIFDNNNPRSVYTADGVTNAYVSGQGTGCDLTGGVFYIPLGKTTNSPTAITGGDAAPTASCIASGYTGSLVAQDTRFVQVYGDTLYLSVDSVEGKSDNRSFIGTLGTPPATGQFTPPLPQTSGYTTGPAQITGLGNAGGTGKETMTAATGNGLNTGLQINISPENYFFASPSVLYVTDSGSPKQTSATSLLGDGGLQKWINSKSDGSGTWSLAYTLHQGLNLVANTSAAGTTGLLGLTGKVSGGVATLYSTNYTIGDLDPSFLYGITDTLTTTSNPGTAFTQLAQAPSDSNFKGVSFAPSLPAGSATITSTPSGLTVTTSGTGCVAGTYTTPVTLGWTPNSTCDLTVTSPQTVSGTQYTFSQWQDGTTALTDAVTAPSSAAVYSATFKQVPTVTFPTASAITYGQPLSASTLSGGTSSVQGAFAFTTPSTVPAAGTTQQSVTFTPQDSTDYASVTGTVSVEAIVSGTTVITAVPTSLSGSAASGWSLTVVLANSGTGTAENVDLTTATLGGVATTTTVSPIAYIGPGASATVTLSFPGSADPSAGKATASFAGTYTGGSFTGGSKVTP